MKIMHLIHSTRHGGGAQSVLANLIFSSSDKYNHKITTLLSNGELPIIKPDYCLGIKSPLDYLTSLRKFRKIVKLEKPDLVMLWMYNSCVLGILALPKHQKKVWSIHHSLSKVDFEKLSTKIMIYISSQISHLPDSIIYCADSIKPQHTKVGFKNDRSIVIPNSFDVDKFTPLTKSAKKFVLEKFNIPKNRFIIGNAGRFHPMKNHSELLLAFSNLLKTHPDIHLVLAGVGINASNANLIELIRIHGVKGNITLLGVQDDMRSFYSILDLYVSASKYGEAFPMVIGEAMACETPVLATDIGDSALIISNTGFHVRSHKADDLTEKLNEALEMSNEELVRLGKLARQRIVQNYSANNITYRYERHFKEVLDA